MKMPHPLQTVSQSDSLIQIADINSHTKWQTVQIQISWLLKNLNVNVEADADADAAGSAITLPEVRPGELKMKKSWYIHFFLLIISGTFATENSINFP